MQRIEKRKTDEHNWKMMIFDNLIVGKPLILSIYLTVDRIFLMEFFDDDKIKLPSNRGVIAVLWSRWLLLLDSKRARIGETLGGGNKFNWFGVNERRLRIDVVYGDK